MILEAVCRGNFTPSDLVIPTDPEYQKSNQTINDLTDELTEKLEPADQKLLNDLITAIYAAQCMESEAFFKFAFAAGMRLQQEAMEQYRVFEALEGAGK